VLCPPISVSVYVRNSRKMMLLSIYRTNPWVTAWCSASSVNATKGSIPIKSLKITALQYQQYVNVNSGLRFSLLWSSAVNAYFCSETSRLRSLSGTWNFCTAEPFSGLIWSRRSKDVHVNRINRLWYVIYIYSVSCWRWFWHSMSILFHSSSKNT